MPPAVAALLVWAGVVTGMVVIGAALAFLAAPLGDFNTIVLPIADGLLIALGVLLLLGINPFARVPQPAPETFGGRGVGVGAFLYGLLFAPIAVPCSGPFLIGIFALASPSVMSLGGCCSSSYSGSGSGFRCSRWAP